MIEQDEIKNCTLVAQELRLQLLEMQETLKMMCNDLKEFEEQGTYRNVDVFSMRKIYDKYNAEDVLNCYGDIFLIQDKVVKNYDLVVYTGKRILWNLELSNEAYEIYENCIYDNENNFEGREYEISVIK